MARRPNRSPRFRHRRFSTVRAPARSGVRVRGGLLPRRASILDDVIELDPVRQDRLPRRVGAVLSRGAPRAFSPSPPLYSLPSKVKVWSSLAKEPLRSFHPECMARGALSLSRLRFFMSAGAGGARVPDRKVRKC